MEKHSFDQTPFLTVAFTVDCQNTTKSIWKEFSPHLTRVQQEPIFASKFKCIKIKFLSSKVSFWSTWVFQEDVFHSSIYSYNPILTHFFLQRPTFDPLPRTSGRNRKWRPEKWLGSVSKKVLIHKQPLGKHFLETIECIKI